MLIKTGGGEVGPAPVTGNGLKTRTFAFSGPLSPPVGGFTLTLLSSSSTTDWADRGVDLRRGGMFY